ncbi:MAG: radical SAM protein [Actinomycetota bacterium]|nr:radical SAM protein [Actinomycetota bacterium]
MVEPADPGAAAERRPSVPIRWRLAADEASGALFSTEELVERHMGVGEYRSMEFLHVNARRLVNRVPAGSRMPFRYTINAYRGCSHACVYCFARPTHEYLGMNAGEDFERRIVVKVNAVERAEAEVRARTWRGEHIAMGTNTDPYQKAEAKYHLTRGIVEVLGRHRNPFSILTKSTLVLRDLDVLTAAAGRTSVRTAFSIGTLDRDVWRLTEPGTPPPEKRLQAVRRLNEAGIPCSVLLAPVLPGLSDREDQLAEVAEACVDAGATSVTPVVLHLRPGVREHYLRWLEGARPDLVALHRERFGRRAYQPEAEQRRVREVVDAAIARAAPPRASPGAGGRPRRAPRLATGHEDPVLPAGSDEPADAVRDRAPGRGRPVPGTPHPVSQLQLF